MIRKMMLMDWRAMKYYQIRIFLLPPFVFLFGLFMSPLFVLPTSVLMFVFFSLNPFAMEEKGELNNLYLTLPVSRDTIVCGRFLLGGVMGICGVIMGIPLTILVNKLGSSTYILPLSWYLFVLAGSYLLFAVCVVATYPILFKLGYNKGKFFGLFIPAIMMGVLYGLFSVLSHLPGNERMMFDLLEYASRHMILTSGIMILVSTAILVFSILISKRIYRKRDF